MARRSSSAKRAASLKRSSKATESKTSSAKRLTRGRTYKDSGRKAKETSRRALDLIKKQRAEEQKKAQRYNEIRSRITILRGPKQVESSWVDQIAYVRYGRNNGVAVKFLSGFEAFYPGTTLKDYEYLRDAASKGKAIWRRFYDLRYEQLN